MHARRFVGVGILALWCAAITLAASTGHARQRDRRVAPAPIPVRYSEGMVHGFLELRTAGGAPLAHGDLLQVPRDKAIESRMIFHFADSSKFEETVTFTQHGVFVMQDYHLVQKGPAFEADLEVTLAGNGSYQVTTRSHADGKVKQYTGTLDLPPDVYNGMVITIAKNLVPRDTQTVHIVAFTPKPRIIGLEFVPSGRQRVLLGQHAETAVHYKLKPKLGGIVEGVGVGAGQDAA